MAAGALLIGAVIALSSCAANPVSGKQDFMLISEQEEIDMGRKVDASVTREYGLYDDPRLTAYVNDMGRRLGKLSHRPQLDYSVKILDASVVNAFAAPGGYLFFTRGSWPPSTARRNWPASWDMRSDTSRRATRPSS